MNSELYEGVGKRNKTHISTVLLYFCFRQVVLVD